MRRVWMERLTLLVLEHPVLSDLDKGVGESWSQWYARLLSVLADGSAMALKHKAGEYPFLSLYGTIDGATFTPFSSPLRFPVPRGFIAELIHFMKSTGTFGDPPKDAALLFMEAPPNIDAAFRRIGTAVEKARRISCPPSAPTYNLDKFASLLASTYVPDAQKSATDETSPGGAPQSRRALDTLQRRLCRVTIALAASDGRIAALEKENLELRAMLAAKDKIISVQAALIVDLKAQNRALQGDLLEAKRAAKVLERRPTSETLVSVNEKLMQERKARRAVERQVEVMKKERTKLRRMLTCAEKGFVEAEAALEAAEKAAAADKSAAAQACVRAAAAERDAMAQVASAQFEAAEWMDRSLDAAVAAEVEKRALRTEEETLAEVRRQAETGEFSDAVRTSAGIVMATECAGGSYSTTFRPGNESGKGRSATYKRIVRSIKPSKLLSPTQMWQRSKGLMAEINRVSGGEGSTCVQTTHLINSNLDLFELALKESRLAPATPLSLDQWAELGTQVSGCMGEQIRTFFRTTCGVKFPTKAHIKAHYAGSHFDFHTFPYTVVELVETKVVQTDGSQLVKISKKYTNGVCGSVRSVEDVLIRMLKHHEKAGNIAYPENIPAGFVPFQICLDAGAGTTKVILKINIIKNSDSVKNLVLLAILSKAKDTYAAMAVAFESIFADFNRINEEGLWIKLGWRPALPLDHSVELFGPQLNPRWKT